MIQTGNTARRMKPEKTRMTGRPRLAIPYTLGMLLFLLCGCVDDQGRGAMHEAVSQCFAAYPFKKGSAYERFNCIALAHQHYGPAAMGPGYGLITQIDQASLSIGQDVDSGALDLPEAETALHWVTIKAQQAAQYPRS